MLRVATIPPLIDMHAEDAAFLWVRRGQEVDGPFLDADDIGRIDQRLDANVEGLMAAGEAGWQSALRRFEEFPEPGELFVLATLALRWADEGALTKAVDAGRPLAERGIKALSGAMARVPKEALRGHVAKWLDARDPFLCALGLSALLQHRIDPGGRLAEVLTDVDEEVRIKALELAGAMGRVDVLALVVQGLEADGERERLAAARAACLLGEAARAHVVLDRLLLGNAGLSRACIELRLLTTPPDAAKRWLQTQLGKPHLRADAVRSIGLFEEKSVMNWLIDKMRDPDLSEAAGLAMRDLFEVDFGDTDLFTTDPASLGKGFAEKEDATLPIADAVEKWLEGGGGLEMRRFQSMRRERHQALRKALAQPAAPLVNWRRTRRYPMWM